MRLYKKAAVCLLAAAMSLCMLTACGGSGSPEKPADSKPGTSEGGEEKPGEKPGENPGESGKDDGEETEDKLPTEWKDSYVMSFLKKSGVSSNYVAVVARLYEDGSKVADGVYAVDGDNAIIQFIEGNKVQYAIEQYQGKYYVGRYNYESDGMTYTISWSEADDSQRLQFEAAQKIFKIPANNEPALSYNCKKLENGNYQEEVVLSGTKYTYTIMSNGYLYTIGTTYGGHNYSTAIQRWSNRPAIPVPDVK